MPAEVSLSVEVGVACASLVGGVGGGRPRALRYALYPSKSMLMLNFLACVSWACSMRLRRGGVPRVVEAPRPQCQLCSLLWRAVAAEDRAQARLELDVVVPVVPLERFVHVVQPIGSFSSAHGKK